MCNSFVCLPPSSGVRMSDVEKRAYSVYIKSNSKGDLIFSITAYPDYAGFSFKVDLENVSMTLAAQDKLLYVVPKDTDLRRYYGEEESPKSFYDHIEAAYEAGLKKGKEERELND